MTVNAKHQKTLELIFENPVRSDVDRSDIESLMLHVGAEISEGRGSSVRIALNVIRGVYLSRLDLTTPFKSCCRL